MPSGLLARGSTREETIENSLIVFTGKLKSWYPIRKRANPRGSLSEINEFTKKMMNDDGDGKVKSKGAETYGLALFLVELFGQYPSLGSDAAALTAAGKNLLDVLGIWNRAGWRLSPDELKMTYEKFNNFIRLTPGDRFEYPKRHLAVHLVKDAARLGNPTVYANWKNESDNKLLKQASREISQATYNTSVLSAMVHIMSRHCAKESVKLKR